jgi:hypothetical protein
MQHRLWSPGGAIIAFIPAAAIDNARGVLNIEVDLILAHGRRVVIPVPTRIAELQQHLSARDGGGVAGVRAWLSARAHTRFELAYPQRRLELTGTVGIYWICGTQREVFLLL